MSGHSKWSTIKRQKGAADIKRGQVFTKLANAITIAAREGGGGDPASNFKLRLAIDQARAANMPKENIQRAIDRGIGKAGVGRLEAVTYEGYGPGKVALLVEATTDNKNRTTAEVKNVIERGGGSFATPGSVSWMFGEEGMIVVPKEGKTFEEIFEISAEAGAEDIVDSGEQVEVYTKPQTLESVKKLLVEKGINPQSAEVVKKPVTTVGLTDRETAQKIFSLLEKLEGLDDVARVWSNFDIPDELLSQIKA
ncbi:MAG: YebC/PmpR family DNA-binding transcriptional regulator [Patescibacteria group bacterium]